MLGNKWNVKSTNIIVVPNVWNHSCLFIGETQIRIAVNGIVVLDNQMKVVGLGPKSLTGRMVSGKSFAFVSPSWQTSRAKLTKIHIYARELDNQFMAKMTGEEGCKEGWEGDYLAWNQMERRVEGAMGWGNTTR